MGTVPRSTAYFTTIGIQAGLYRIQAGQRIDPGWAGSDPGSAAADKERPAGIAPGGLVACLVPLLYGKQVHGGTHRLRLKLSARTLA
jgi:hypothetical protein